ncbi:MAG: serine/threonine protein kinase [Deltaproteobacteria bacterium]|nr:serine/threonine protein kinase [Deltaproteobacteria bacterium]
MSEAASHHGAMEGVPAAIGRYRILCELGHGGMGSLYLGRAEGPGGFERLVAIKTIHPHLAKRRAFLDMFLDEARIAARIHHPNVVSVYEVGEDRGRHFLVMDYVSGETMALALSTLWRTRKLMPVHLAAHLIAAASEGLHAAHELRDREGQPLHVVHRDVSPQNLLLGFDGVVRVSDFGVAKAAGQLASTEPGTRKGKFAYMAPEQLEATAVDRRADIFALGVVLWESIVCRRLFRGANDFQTAQRILAAAVRPPSEIRKDCPAELEAIVMKALARRPEQRYQTARDMGAALHRMLVSRSVAVTVADVDRFMLDTFPERHTARLEMERKAVAIDDREDSRDEIQELSQLLVVQDLESPPGASDRSPVGPPGLDLPPEAADTVRPTIPVAPSSGGPGQDVRVQPSLPPDLIPYPDDTGVLLASSGLRSPSARKRRAAFVAAAACAALGVAFLVANPDAPAPSSAAAVAAPEEAQAAEAAAPPGIAETAPAPNPAEATTVDPPAAPRAEPRTVELTFEVSPADAKIRVNGQPLAGPLRVPEASRQEIEVTAPKFRSYRATVEATQSRVVRIQLQPLSLRPDGKRVIRRKGNRRGDNLLSGEDL